MPPDLILKIHRVTDVRPENRSLGRTTPELYVSVRVKTSECEHRRKTKCVRDLTAQWEEGFTLHATEKDHSVRFCLKAAFCFSCDRILGEAECKVSDLLHIPGTPTIQKNIELFNINGAKARELSGTIVVSAEYFEPQSEERCLSSGEEKISHMEHTRQLAGDQIQEPPEHAQALSGTASQSSEAQISTPQELAECSFADTSATIDKQSGPDSLPENVGHLPNEMKYTTSISSSSYKTPSIQRDLKPDSINDRTEIPHPDTIHRRLEDQERYVSKEEGQSSQEEEIPSEVSQDSPQDTRESSQKDSELPAERRPQVADTHNFRREAAEATLTKTKDIIKQQLGPGTLFEKVGKLQDKLEKLDGIVSAIDELAKLHSWTDFAWRACKSLYKVVENQHSTDQKMINLVDTMEGTLDFVGNAERIKEDAIPLQPIIQDLLKQVVECATFISAYLQPSFGKRMAKRVLVDPSSKITEFTDEFTKLRKSLKGKVHLHNGLVSGKILGIVGEIYDLIVLSALNPTDMNAANRPLCLPGTRRNVLREIVDWIVDVEEPEQNILWLHGLAGSGKSTIVNTIANHLHEMKRLGGFLFFERDKTDQDTVVRTMAYQLARADPVLQSGIGTALKQDQWAASQCLETQFTHLIHGPLVEAAKSLLGPIVIVIDALDEFGDIDSRESFLDLISDELTKLPNNFRFLVTSRPEQDINNLFLGNPKIKSTSLTNGKDVIPEVRLYLSSEFARIRQKKRRITSSWPENADLEEAAQMSEGLFIWASTLSKFLRKAADPTTQLKRILSSENKTYAKGLEHLYATVLLEWSDWDEGLKERFRDVAGIILFCHVPISDVVVDQLLGLPEADSSTIKHRSLTHPQSLTHLNQNFRTT